MLISFARTLVLASPTPDPLAPLRWPAKSPGSQLDYSVNLAAVLGETQDTIASFAFVVNGTGPTLTNADQPLVPGSCTVTTILSGGTSIQDNSLTLQVTTAAGLVYEIDIWVLVERMAPSDLMSPPVVVGAAGRGIKSITQPNGPASMLVTYTDNTTQTVALPQPAGTSANTQFLTIGGTP
jgi:hypothetical protein